MPNPKAKDNMAVEGAYEIRMPPERHVPITSSEIVECFRPSVPTSERQLFSDICKLIEACSTTEFLSIRARVKKNFRLFSAAALHKTLPTRRGRPLKKETVMDEQELLFLEDFFELMNIAHYDCITAAEWTAAKQERYMLDMPIAINWNFMDSRLLSRFFERHPERRPGLYPHAEHCLVFHRGVGSVQLEDLFIARKIDLLVDYLVAYPAQKVWEAIKPWVTKRQTPAELAAAKANEPAAAPMGTTRELLPGKPSTPGVAGAKGPLQRAPTAPGPAEHQHVKVIQRQALRLMLPTYKHVFRKLFAKLTVREPTYKDIITLYRKKVTPPTDKEMKKHPECISKFRYEQRNIVVKRFGELPIADLEIVLPDKEVSLKLVDKLTLYGTALGAVVAGATAFWGANVELSYILSTLGIMGGKLFQTYTNMVAKKAEMTKQMSLKVYDISLDSQEGVLFSILDEMSDQYVKEMLLAYLLLYRSRESATDEGLDEACEGFLEDKFDVRIDFAMDESLPRLVNNGLVRRSPHDNTITAVDLETANANLLQKWHKAFQYNDASTGSLTAAITDPAAGLAHMGSNLAGGLAHIGSAGGRAVIGALGAVNPFGSASAQRTPSGSASHAHSGAAARTYSSGVQRLDSVSASQFGSGDSMMGGEFGDDGKKKKKKWYDALRRRGSKPPPGHSSLSH